MLSSLVNNLSPNRDLLLCVGGTSGSGKTTLAHLLSYYANGPLWRHFIFAADDYFTSEDGKYNFDPTKLPEAHADCQARVNESLLSNTGTGSIVVVHNTFTEEDHYAPYKAIAEKHGWIFNIVWVGNHHGSKDVHDVPAVAIERQSKAIGDLLLKLGTSSLDGGK